MTVMGRFRHLKPKIGGSADRLEMHDQMMSFWHHLFPLGLNSSSSNSSVTGPDPGQPLSFGTKKYVTKNML